MAGVNFIGSYSGIDKNTIEQLMSAEKLPLIQLSNKKISITEKQNAWKDVNTRLNSLFEKLKALQTKDTFSAKTSTSTNDKNVSMTAEGSAVAGTYNISVSKLATNSSTIFGKSDNASIGDGKYSNTKDLGISGNFTIKNKDGDSTTIQITTGGSNGDSLQSIVNKINGAAKDTKVGETTIKGTGISATIVDNRLVLTDTKSGDRDITLTSGDNSLVDLGLDYVTTDPDKKASKLDGQLAEFTINGVKVNSDSNTATGVVDGATINLTRIHSNDEYDTVTIAQDNTSISKAMQEFVEQYNSTMSFIEDKLKAGDPKVVGSKGALSGDSSLMRLHSSLRNLVTSTVDNTDIKDISKLGVSTLDKSGQLKFDSSKFIKALAENPDNVRNFFNSKDLDDNEIGFVPRLKNYMDSFITGNKSVINTKTQGFEKTLKDLEKQIDNFSARMVQKEAYYVKKFTALDVALMKAEGQMSWLQGQVDSMNGSKR